MGKEYNLKQLNDIRGHILSSILEKERQANTLGSEIELENQVLQIIEKLIESYE